MIECVNGDWIVAFPMYDFPELSSAHERLWQSVREILTASVRDPLPARLHHGLSLEELWGHPGLLLGQGCEYPLAQRFKHTVQLVATPRYRAEGCTGATYRSAILVHRDDPASSLAALRGTRCIINDPVSNSGMNLLRAAIAPLAAGAPFFSEVRISGSHRNSIESINTGKADVAAVDCVTLAQLRRLYPQETAAVRVLAWTAATPSLPYITGAATDPQLLSSLRGALSSLSSHGTWPELRDELLLDGFDVHPASDYGHVLRLEAEAVALGYHALH